MSNAVRRLDPNDDSDPAWGGCSRAPSYYVEGDREHPGSNLALRGWGGGMAQPHPGPAGQKQAWPGPMGEDRELELAPWGKGKWLSPIQPGWRDMA